MQLTPEDQRSKHLMITKVATEVTARGAEDVIFASELWEAPELPADDERAATRPEERDDRTESFMTCLLRRRGEHRLWRSPMMRPDDTLTLGDPEEFVGEVPAFLAPILDAWSQWPE